jgi:hypothetical protein
MSAAGAHPAALAGSFKLRSVARRALDNDRLPLRIPRVAISGTIGDRADDGARGGTRRSADSRPSYIARDQTPGDSAGTGADPRACPHSLFVLRAGCKSQSGGARKR